MFVKLLLSLGLTVLFGNFISPVQTSLLVPVTTIKTTVKPPTVKPFNSKRLLLSLAKRVFKQFGICNRDMRVFIPNEKEREKKIQCSVKCVLKKLFIVNDKDLINEKSMMTFLKTFLPEDYHEVTYFMMEGCVEEFVEKGFGPLQEDYCESYGEFLRCIQDNITVMV
ncbi:unnamed protein product [Allacma fusca]|uniref:Uncharacterized protein n=1 Tax=Allacma fusca TaxID=39272 RepID=A0A8J2LIM7_9HEXA|nr:unnamed protein product [Allacma fusca]